MELTKEQKEYLLGLFTKQLQVELALEGKPDDRDEARRIDTYSLQMGIETLGRLIDDIDWAIDDQEFMDCKDVVVFRMWDLEYTEVEYEVEHPEYGMLKDINAKMEEELVVRGY